MALVMIHALVEYHLAVYMNRYGAFVQKGTHMGFLWYARYYPMSARVSAYFCIGTIQIPRSHPWYGLTAELIAPVNPDLGICISGPNSPGGINISQLPPSDSWWVGFCFQSCSSLVGFQRTLDRLHELAHLAARREGARGNLDPEPFSPISHLPSNASHFSQSHGRFSS